jgi:hypothetical protein
VSQWIFYNLRICKIFLQILERCIFWSDTWICSLRLFLMGVFCLKIEAKMYAKQAQSFLKCSRIKFIQIWQTLQQSLLLENLVLLLNIGKTYLHEDKCYSIQEIFRRVLVVFLQSWMFLQPCEVFANFCANYFAKWTSVAKNFYRNLACFAFLAFYIHIFFL